jgi:hypothetical protein
MDLPAVDMIAGHVAGVFEENGITESTAPCVHQKQFIGQVAQQGQGSRVNWA